jgi:hypothetical protein
VQQHGGGILPRLRLRIQRYSIVEAACGKQQRGVAAPQRPVFVGAVVHLCACLQEAAEQCVELVG